MSRWAPIAAVALLCVAASSRGARLAGAPEARRLALVVRLDAVAGQRPEHVADLRSAPGLVVGLVGAPRVEGTQCTLRFVITNLTDRVAYNPRVRLARRGAPRGESVVTIPLVEGSAGLSTGSISKEVVATLELASLGAPPSELLAIPESAPRVSGTVGRPGVTPGAFSKPRGLAIDARGRLVVADRGNNRVQLLSAEGKPLESWGRLGSAVGEFDHPGDVEIDLRTGQIYVCDMNNARIQVLSSQGRHLASWPTDGAALNHPSDVALSPDGALYVADAGNMRIIRLDAQGRMAGGWGEFGEGPGQFRAILDVETDAQGRVYVSDGSNATVQVFTAEGRLVSRFGRGAAGGDRIRYPTAITPLAGDRVLVADFADDRIMAFSLDGTFLAEFGRAGHGLGEFQYPNDMVLDRSRLFVSQTASDTITIFELKGWWPFDESMRR